MKVEEERRKVHTGVQKFNPDLFPLLKARPSVEITVATAWIRSSSNAADIRIGCGNDVAYEKSSPGLAKLTPGESATPCNASCHLSGVKNIELT
jgi:hypothetical protein